MHKLSDAFYLSSPSYERKVMFFRLLTATERFRTAFWNCPSIVHINKRQKSWYSLNKIFGQTPKLEGQWQPPSKRFGLCKMPCYNCTRAMHSVWVEFNPKALTKKLSTHYGNSNALCFNAKLSSALLLRTIFVIKKLFRIDLELFWLAKHYFFSHQ